MKIELTPTFERGYKRLKRKKFDMKKLEKVIKHITLNENDILTNKYKDHYLKGKLKGCKELHIEKDWLLVYQIINQDEVILLLLATGKHDDVFRNAEQYL